MFKVVLDKKGFLKRVHPINSQSKIYLEPQQNNRANQNTRIVDPFKKVFYQSLFKYYDELNQQSWLEDFLSKNRSEKQPENKQPEKKKQSEEDDFSDVEVIHIDDVKRPRSSIGDLLKRQQDLFNISVKPNLYDVELVNRVEPIKILKKPPPPSTGVLLLKQEQEQQLVPIKPLQLVSGKNNLQEIQGVDIQNLLDEQILPLMRGRKIPEIMKKPNSMEFINKLKNNGLLKYDVGVDAPPAGYKLWTVPSEYSDDSKYNILETVQQLSENLPENEQHTLFNYLARIFGVPYLIWLWKYLFRSSSDKNMKDDNMDDDDITIPENFFEIDKNTTDLVLPNKVVSEKPLELVRQVTPDIKTISPEVVEETEKLYEETVKQRKQKQRRKNPRIIPRYNLKRLATDSIDGYRPKKLFIPDKVDGTDEEFYQKRAADFEDYVARETFKNKMFNQYPADFANLAADLFDLNKNESVRDVIKWAIPATHYPDDNKFIKSLLSLEPKQLEVLNKKLFERSKLNDHDQSIVNDYKVAMAIVNNIKKLRTPMREVYWRAKQTDDEISNDLIKRFGKNNLHSTRFQNAFKF